MLASTHGWAARAGRRVGVLLVIPLALGLSSCGLFKELPPVPTLTPTHANLLQNSGFESGDQLWATQDGGGRFSISDSTAHSGGHSLLLRLRGDAGDTGTRVASAAQSIDTTTFPEYVSGFYRVDGWKPTAGSQYLQFTVVVHGGDFGDNRPVHEMRFAIAGLQYEPFGLRGGAFVFLSRAAPVLHRWTYFGYPVKDAFARALGRAPGRWDSIAFLFEVRYDGKPASQSASVADVYFDDLYAGSQLDNPNRPAR